MSILEHLECCLVGKTVYWNECGNRCGGVVERLLGVYSGTTYAEIDMKPLIKPDSDFPQPHDRVVPLSRLELGKYDPIILNDENHVPIL